MKQFLTVLLAALVAAIVAVIWPLYANPLVVQAFGLTEMPSNPGSKGKRITSDEFKARIVALRELSDGGLGEVSVAGPADVYIFGNDVDDRGVQHIYFSVNNNWFVAICERLDTEAVICNYNRNFLSFIM